MASLTTRQTIVLLDKAEYLGRTIRTHKGHVNSRLDAVYGGVSLPGDGEQPRRTDWDSVQESNLELLGSATKETRDLGHTHRLNQVKLSQLRNQRDGIVGELHDRHDSLKWSVHATYGPDKLELFGLESAPVRRFLGVREQCLDVTERMRRPELREQLGEPRAGHAHLQLEGLADGMERDIKRFEAVYDAIEDMRKVLHLSLVARNDARSDLNRKYVNIARIQEGMFRIAGLDDLADRIRVTIPARPKKSDASEDDAAQAGAAPADAGLDETPPADPAGDAASQADTGEA